MRWLFFVVGAITFWSGIKSWRERNELEIAWERAIAINSSEILSHPERYRQDFRLWIKENHPHLILHDSEPLE